MTGRNTAGGILREWCTRQVTARVLAPRINESGDATDSEDVW
jgi:hypothetical protein